MISNVNLEQTHEKIVKESRFISRILRQSELLSYVSFGMFAMMSYGDVDSDGLECPI